MLPIFVLQDAQGVVASWAERERAVAAQHDVLSAAHVAALAQEEEQKAQKAQKRMEEQAS